MRQGLEEKFYAYRKLFKTHDWVKAKEKFIQRINYSTFYNNECFLI
jgi:hypothetical protein